MLPPRGVSTAHRTRTNFFSAGDLCNVINHPRQMSNRLKYNCDFGEELKFHVLALLRRTPLKRLSPAGLPVILAGTLCQFTVNMNSGVLHNSQFTVIGILAGTS